MKSKSTSIFWAGLVFSYLFTRLVNLNLIPIFTDEAIYTFWAQVALNDPENRFISMRSFSDERLLNALFLLVWTTK